MPLNFQALRDLIVEQLTQQSEGDRITGVELRTVETAIVNMMESVYGSASGVDKGVLTTIAELDAATVPGAYGASIATAPFHPILVGDFSVLVSKESDTRVQQLAWGIVDSELKVASRSGLKTGLGWDEWLALKSKAAEVSYNNTYTTVEAALDKLLYVAPQINSFTGGGTYEIGSVRTVTLLWAYNKAITEQKIDGVIYGLAARSKEYLDVSADVTHTLWATDGTNSISGTQSVLFRFYKFWGVGATPSGSTDADRRTAIISKNPTFAPIQAGTFDMNTGNVETNFFVCLPPGLLLASVYDATANATIVFSSPTDYSIVDAGGTTRVYKMYTATLGAAYSSSHIWRITTSLG